MGISIRHKVLYKEYKSNRKDYYKIFDAETEEEIDKIIREARTEISRKRFEELKKLKEEYLILPEIFNAIKIPFCSVQHVEADDIISLITNKVYEKYDRILIFSTDSDLFQLIDYEKVYIATFQQVLGLNIDTDSILIGTKILKEIYGYIPPFFISFVKAMAGDTSDNIKGVPRIGTATLTKGYFNTDNRALLKRSKFEYKNSEEAYINFLNFLKQNPFSTDEYKKLVKKLEEHKEDFINSFRLVDLNFERLINEEFGERIIKQIKFEDKIISVNDFFKSLNSREFYQIYLKLRL